MSITTTPKIPLPTALRGDATAVFKLNYPVEFNGRIYYAIGLRRMTARDVQAFIEEVTEKGEAARLPIYDVPIEILDGMDADDRDDFEKLLTTFLPRSLKLEAPVPPVADSAMVHPPGS